jgi:3-oxoacyl-[acyl-carrier protein] reductase
MDLQLDGKRALITGSSTGIGAAIARVLAHEGADVFIHGRDPERTKRVVAEVSTKNVRTGYRLGDLTRDDDARELAHAAIGAFGGIDILVNNAGGQSGVRSFLELTPEQWLRTIDANLMSAVRMSRLLAPQMVERGWGRIIQIGSATGTQPNPTMSDYQASKAALVNATVSLAKALGGTGVTVNIVSAGAVMTPAVEQHLHDIAQSRGWDTNMNLEELEKRVCKEVYPNPAGRMGRAEDVANMVAFVASPLNGFIHGANLRIDGGRVGSIN